MMRSSTLFGGLGLALSLLFLATSPSAVVLGKKVDITCDPLEGGQIDWDCIFGPESLEEVHDRGGTFTTCKEEDSNRPCSRFIVAKDKERSEVKVQEGPEIFPFKKGEKYIFKYSFRAVEGMKVATRFTHLGQIKGSKEGYMIKGDPLYSLTANKYGLMVRFSNLESIEDFHPGMNNYLSWEDATGDWVNVKITTVFGNFMVVELSGAVNGKAEWPLNLKPVAWHRDAEMARMKLGLYHARDHVADGEVEYRDISIEGPRGIIRTTPESSVKQEDNGEEKDNGEEEDDDEEEEDDKKNKKNKTKKKTKKNNKKTKKTTNNSTSRSIEGTCSASGQCEVIDTTCDALEDNQIDWDCIFGPDSLEEVHQRGGKFTTCRKTNSRHPCSRFIVKKNQERSEVKVQEGPDGFPFLKGEKYVFSYSFRAVEGMKVSNRFTHLGQLKGSKGGYMIKGDPIYSLTANDDGLMVRFSNKESIGDFYSGFEKSLSWKDSAGQWVHVKITTVFGESMEVELSGAVSGKAVWPKNLKPVAWHKDAEMVRMKLGLYHKTNEVADGEVEYRDIMIKGPNGTIRTSPRAEPSGSLYRGCFEDQVKDRVLQKAKYVDGKMTAELCEDLCEGSEYFGMEYGTECWCGGSKSKLFKHGKSDKCTTDCPGSSKIEKCGGSKAISIFQYEGSPKDIPSSTNYVGCFVDSSSARALAFKSTSDDSGMDHRACKKFCDSAGAKYFGLQFSKECFCGEDGADYDRHGAGICHMPCSDNDTEICGGSGAMSVFRITEK